MIDFINSTVPLENGIYRRPMKAALLHISLKAVKTKMIQMSVEMHRHLDTIDVEEQVSHHAR